MDIESEVESVSLLTSVPLFAAPGTVAHQDLLSMEFSRKEYWSGLPFPSPGDLPNWTRGDLVTCLTPWNADQTHVSCLEMCSLQSEPPGKFEPLGKPIMEENFKYFILLGNGYFIALDFFNLLIVSWIQFIYSKVCCPRVSGPLCGLG